MITNCAVKGVSKIYRKRGRENMQRADTFLNSINHGADTFFGQKNHGAKSFFRQKNHGQVLFLVPGKSRGRYFFGKKSRGGYFFW